MLLARVADAIYWMARYIERAENVARLVDVNAQLTLDRAGGLSEQWSPLVSITGDEDHFAKRYDDATRTAVTRFMTFDLEYPNSIASCIRAARENARTIRDTITEEMWEQVNAFYLMMQRAEKLYAHDEPHNSFYEAVRHASQLFNGITDATMARGMAWEFARLGRVIERADKTSRILDVKYFLLLPRPEDVGTALDVVQWSALLRSAGALEMYRQKHGAIVPARVAELLILDQTLPRSLVYCLIRAEESVRAIAGPTPHPAAGHAQRLVGRLRSRLAYSTIDEIIRQGMHEYLDKLQADLNTIDAGLTEAFFAPKHVPDAAVAPMLTLEG